MMDSRFSRRGLVAQFGSLLAASALAACASQSAPASQPAAATPNATSSAVKPTAPPVVKPLQAATLRLSYLATDTHVGFYLALARGHYREAGLDVQINEGQGTATTLQLIGQTKDTFGAASAEGLVKAVQEGIPAKAVAATAQKSPLAIIMRTDTGVRRVQDLPGHRLGGTAGGTAERIFPALLAAANVNPSSVEIIPTSPANIVPLMLQKKVDGMFGYNTNSVITSEGPNVVVLNYADYGINMIGDTLVANVEWLKGNGDLTRRFVAASLKGWEDTIQSPEAAVQAISQYASGFKVEGAVDRVKIYLGLLHSKRTGGKPLGWMDPQDWQETEDLLRKYELVKTTLPVESYFTNDYLPAAR